MRSDFSLKTNEVKEKVQEKNEEKKKKRKKKGKKIIQPPAVQPSS